MRLVDSSPVVILPSPVEKRTYDEIMCTMSDVANVKPLVTDGSLNL